MDAHFLLPSWGPAAVSWFMPAPAPTLLSLIMAKGYLFLLVAFINAKNYMT